MNLTPDIILQMLEQAREHLVMANRVSKLLLELGFVQTTIDSDIPYLGDYVNGKVEIAIDDMIVIKNPKQTFNCFRLTPPLATKDKGLGAWASTTDPEEFLETMKKHFTELIRETNQ